MKTHRTILIVYAAAFASLVFGLTMIAIPLPMGNINLGDCAMLLSAWILPAPFAALSSAIGASLSDVFSAYSVYAPATFLIKAAASLAAIALKRLTSRLPVYPSLLLSALAAEAVMALGYLLYEGCFLYGFQAALLNLPFNLIQGAIAVALAPLLMQLLRSTHLFPNFKSPKDEKKSK